MKPDQSHVAGLELALERWNEGGPAIQFAHLLADLIAQAKSAPAEVAQGEVAGYRCRFIKEPEHRALRAACVDFELHSAFESHVMSMSESRRPSDFRIGMDGEYVNSWMRANFAIFCAGRNSTTKESLVVAPA